MMMNINEGTRWVQQAEHDLEDAKYNREGGKHNLTCFLSQQAAEKQSKDTYTSGELKTSGGIH